MKIDFIIGSLRAGGAERVVSILANYFAENGHEVRIITFMEGDEYVLHSKVTRIKFHNKYLLFNYVITKALISLLFLYFKNKPDIISSHIGKMGIATIPIAKLYRIKITVSEHFNHFNQKTTMLTWILWNFLYKFPDAITVLTEFDIPFFIRKNKNVVVMFNPCSFTPIKDLQKKREKVILAVGNLNRYYHKGFDNLIEIALHVLKENPNWKLKIVGEGEEGLTSLKAKLVEFDLKDKIIFTGYRSDIEELMSRSEIFILTSRHEGLPMVLIEAMSQGMVCISYDCISGPSDIITNKKDGVLVNDQNKKEMIYKLNELLKNDSLRSSLRENTPKALDKFNLSVVGQKWVELFNSITR